MMACQLARTVKKNCPLCIRNQRAEYCAKQLDLRAPRNPSRERIRRPELACGTASAVGLGIHRAFIAPTTTMGHSMAHSRVTALANTIFMGQ